MQLGWCSVMTSGFQVHCLRQAGALLWYQLLVLRLSAAVQTDVKWCWVRIRTFCVMNTKWSAVNWNQFLSGLHPLASLFACVRLCANLTVIRWYDVGFCAWRGLDLLSTVMEDCQSHALLVNLSLEATIYPVVLGQLQVRFDYFCLKATISLFVPEFTYAFNLGLQDRLPSSDLHHLESFLVSCDLPFLLHSSFFKSHLFEIFYVSSTVHFPVIAVCLCQ